MTVEKSNKNTMPPALGTNGGRSKSTTVFTLKFDTIAKLKVTSVLEIFVSLRYVMHMHMICEKMK